MATVTYHDPVRDIRGTFQKGGIINRRKTYRDEKGRIVNESAPEAYAVRHPRDWKRNPATGKELECQNRFKAASAQTRRILLAAKPGAYAAAHNGSMPRPSVASIALSVLCPAPPLPDHRLSVSCVPTWLSSASGVLFLRPIRRSPFCIRHTWRIGNAAFASVH